MNSNSLIQRLNQLEEWLEKTKSKHHLLPLRMGGYLLLILVLMISNFLAVVRWPLASLKRKFAERSGNPERSILPNAVNEIAPKQLDHILQGTKPVLIDFWAEWCGPCIMMNKPLKKLAESENIDCTIVKVNTVQHQELATQYNVKGLPTLLLMKEGEEIKRSAGALSYQELKKFITQ
ncbi:thioredoxin family protein [Fodinibius saliphilus]|uniref:thioredoxin family protein n=1 Tax=Fodinibius saliphilus TaxID=1920650 RepID=UPI001108E3FE|nr:thioredoxin family protein [Fodinibius saliphilus]